MRTHSTKNLILLLTLVFIVFILAILITDSFYIHESFTEIQNFNKLIYEKVDYFETTTGNEFKNLEIDFNKKLKKIEENQVTLSKGPVNEPSTTEWGFVIFSICSASYVIIQICCK